MVPRGIITINKQSKIFTLAWRMTFNFTCAKFCEQVYSPSYVSMQHRCLVTWFVGVIGYSNDLNCAIAGAGRLHMENKDQAIKIWSIVSIVIIKPLWLVIDCRNIKMQKKRKKTALNCIVFSCSGKKWLLLSWHVYHFVAEPVAIVWVHSVPKLTNSIMYYKNHYGSLLQLQ